MIELINISKSYGKRRAGEDLSLTVKGGELFGFLGPNGTGKTTTIKIITGLMRPESGQAKICGIDVAHQPEAAKMKIGYVPDTPYLYEKLTAREYLEFAGGLYGVPHKELSARIEWLCDLFGMNGWADRRCEEYSPGMKQKVRFGAAFVQT